MYHFYDTPKLASDNSYCGTIEDGLKMLCSDDAGLHAAHNACMHDIPLIEKLYPEYRSNGLLRNWKKSRDTLVMSRLLDPERPQGHSLESYNDQIGISKVVHDDWSRFSEDMLHRCSTDVRMQAKLYLQLTDKMNRWQDGNWGDALELEQELCYVCAEMCKNGVTFDIKKANRLVRLLDYRMSRIEQKLDSKLPLSIVNEGTLKKPFLKSGAYTSFVTQWIQNNNVPAEMFPEGPFTRISYEKLNLSSNDQVKTWLLTLGWKPTDWNYKKDKKSGRKIMGPDGKPQRMSPILKEDSYDSIKGEVGRPIAHFLKMRHKRSVLKGKSKRDKTKETGLIPAYDPATGKVYGGIIPGGAATGRATHKVIANIPRAGHLKAGDQAKAKANGDRVRPGTFCGNAFRSLFKASPGKIMVGIDASALENRIDASFCMPYDNGLRAEMVLDGDVHQKTADKMGCDRATAKTFNYALPYGASPAKISFQLGCGLPKAQKLWDAFYKANPGVAAVKAQLLKAWKARGGYIKGIDGRRIKCTAEHKLFNYLVQPTGDIVMKRFFCLAHRACREAGIDVQWLIYMHDEVVAEMDPKDVERYKEIVEPLLTEAGKYYKIRVPIVGDCKVGKSWREVH
jgi:hypothetical protein